MFSRRCHAGATLATGTDMCVPYWGRVLSPSRKRVWSQAEDVDDQKSLTGRRREGTRLHGTPVSPKGCKNQQAGCDDGGLIIWAVSRGSAQAVSRVDTRLICDSRTTRSCGSF